MKYKITLLILSCFTSISIFAQQGIVSGVLSDDKGLALIGVNILIKGTTNGTVTDIDGNYSIECEVGDILVISYTGMKTREVEVTLAMFEESLDEELEYMPVSAIKSKAYTNAIKKLKRKDDAVLSLNNSNRTYNKSNGYFQYKRIKEIEIQENKLKLTYFRPDVYFEAGYHSNFGVQFIRDKNLPELQNTFSQGMPISGELIFQGAETGNMFSYGPALSTLEFDGSNYIYDGNGGLVNQGTGNGLAANAYDSALFENAIINSNQLFFNISTNTELFGFDFFNENAKDIYDRELSFNNRISLSYNKDKRSRKLGWKTFLTYQTKKDNQANINGFHNNLLFNLWATPPSFSNEQGTILPDNTPRRFNAQFNNPEWILNNNRNSIESQSFVASVQNAIEIVDDIELQGKLSYRYNQQEQKFGFINGTAGFEDGFSTDKNIKENNLNASASLSYVKYKNNNNLELKSIVNYAYNDLGFSLLESSGFAPFSFTNPLNSIETNQSESRSILRLLNQVKYEIDHKLEFRLTNNSYHSSIQNDKWVLPSLYAKLDFKELFYMDYDIHKFSLSSSISFDVNDMSLYYNNLSHNSLLLSPRESLTYTSNNDLFINPTVELERIINYEINFAFGIYGHSNFIFTYYNSKTKGSVFPIINNGVFELDNVADIKNSGVEFSIVSKLRIANDFYYKPSFSFSTYNTKVLKILNNEERIPIAGFSTIAKNLIVDQPAGVIVGSAYLRDEQNNIVIGDDGFPLVNPTPQIIGDPIPDYHIGFANNFRWKKLELNVLIDIQKGGDIWNGTQNVLNYLGTSQQSAEERGITNFVFDGVNQQGNTNTILVDFYNPNNLITENRFVRYGFEGLGEAAIVDGSYINIKSIDINYSFYDRYDNKFLRMCKLGLYAKNLFTWSKFKGHSPYGALYGNISGQELNFFNMPNLTEVGLILKLKI